MRNVRFWPGRLAALGVFCAASIAVLFAIDSYARYQDEIAAAKITALNFARIFATHTAMTFENVDIKLREVEAVRKNQMSGTTAPANLELRQLQKGTSAVVALGWTDASGEVVAHSYGRPLPRNNISDMTHFVVQRDNPDRGLFIAPPYRSAATGQWLTAASRRLSNPDGSFAGIVTAPIDQAYFSKLYRTIDLGNGGSVLLLHRAGRILAREPFVESAIGKSLADGSLLSESVPRSEEGFKESISPVDGIARIASYKVVPGLPLVLVVSYARADVLAGWYAHLYKFGPLVVIVVVTILFGTYRLSRQSRDLQRQTEESRQKSLELEQTNLWFEAALGNMPHGLSMFGADERLLVVNGRYGEMYGLSDEQLKPGTLLKDILRDFEATSEGADFNRPGFVQGVHERVPYVLTLADGRKISIVRTPMKSGGWVATHEDITEKLLAAAVLAESAAQLRRTHDRFHTAISNMKQGLCLFDGDKRLLVSNSRYQEIYRLPDELVVPGTSLQSIFEFYAERGDLEDANLDRHVQGDRQYVQAADGREILVQRKPLADGGWVATHEDITEQRRLEASLAEKAADLEQTNRLFDAALSNMSQGLCLFDADKNLVISNGRFQEMYGLPDELVRSGTPLDRILHFYEVRGDAGNMEVDHHTRLIGMEHRQNYAPKDGRNILIQRCPLSDGGWVATHQDITEQKRLEISLAEKAADFELVNAHFDAALNSMSQGLSLFDAEQKVIVSNLRYAEIYNLDREQTKPGTTLAQILEYRRQKGTNHVVAADVYLSVNVRKASEIQELADGRFVAINRRQMADGGWLTVHEDITEQRKIEQERDRNRAFLHQIIEHIPTQITVKDARDRRYVLLNRVAEGQLGPSSELVGKTAYDIFSTAAADIITRDDDAALGSDDGVFVDEHEFETRNGNEERFVTARRVSIRGENGEPAYLINLVEDVTERKRSNDRIAFLAHHDQLTGLANRARFTDRLDEAARRLARHGTPFAILMLDLDKFKYVNDTLGHPAGDQLLIEVARRLASSLRDTDVLARLGGDEFAIIQEGEGNQREAAIGLALRVIDIIGKPFDLNGNQANIGTSIGIAFASENDLDAQSLLKKADLALYAAKSEGRNDYRLFQPEMAEVSDTQKVLEGELREAIQNDEFELHYQPVVDAKSGTICGAEALVRWRHRSKGLVLPDQFIPLAESTGLMLPLGEWILQRACQDAASWPSHVKVAINISAVQFNNANIFDVVLCALVESGLSPERLELEITETMLLKNEQAGLLAIRQLKNLGIAIVLDDFGIGYSSTSYLTRFHFDKIKIDKSFVQGFPDRRECAAIIQSVLALARGLDMDVTAEGVETHEQFEALRSAGVGLVQGYLFGRPVPLHQLAWSAGGPQAQNVA